MRRIGTKQRNPDIRLDIWIGVPVVPIHTTEGNTAYRSICRRKHRNVSTLPRCLTTPYWNIHTLQHGATNDVMLRICVVLYA